MAKKRLEVILDTLSGEKTIAEACKILGIGEAAFHKLRSRWLQEALGELEPRRRGRPPGEPDPRSSRIEELEKENRDLRLELHAQLIREEIALTMPHLLKKTPKRKKD